MRARDRDLVTVLGFLTLTGLILIILLAWSMSLL